MIADTLACDRYFRRYFTSGYQLVPPAGLAPIEECDKLIIDTFSRIYAYNIRHEKFEAALACPYPLAVYSLVLAGNLVISARLQSSNTFSAISHDCRQEMSSRTEFHRNSLLFWRK